MVHRKGQGRAIILHLLLVGRRVLEETKKYIHATLILVQVRRNGYVYVYYILITHCTNY